jgi:hypothetical protein
VLDVLFVVDRSPAMADVQQALAAAVPKFGQVLESRRLGPVDMHIGVVSAMSPMTESFTPRPAWPAARRHPTRS